VSDATKSVSRAYINNFQDKNKQAAIDMFLVRIESSIPITNLFSRSPRETSVTSDR
jgi:hypothetical protein